MTNTPSVSSQPGRNYLLDLVKAICISLVLIGHLETIDISAPKLTAYHFNLILKQGIIFFYFNVIFLAVPTFLIVSLFLYYRNFEKHGDGYLIRRVLHLTGLFFFWVFLQYLIYYLIVVYKPGEPLQAQLSQLATTFNMTTFLLAGGPKLPIVGDSVFYFFSELIFLTILASLYYTYARTGRYATIIGIAWIIIFLVYFEICCFLGLNIPYSHIQSFGLYVPLAYFLYKTDDKFSWPFLLFVFAGYLLFSFQDYILRGLGINFNIYARPSLVFGATTLFYAIKNLKSFRETRVVTLLSTYSLGIFAIHKYFRYMWIVLLDPVFEAIGLTPKISIWLFRVNVQVWILTVLTLLLTFLSVYLLNKTPLKQYVR
jgi:hypothetical protein